jgi:hypothetical protein
MPIHSFGACNLPFDVSVNSPNVISAVAESTLASPSESAQVSVPVIWNQANDSYYEPDPNGGSFYRYVGSSSQIQNGSAVYFTQPDLTVHSYVKVANLFEDRSVNYYISLNDPSLYKPFGVFENDNVTPNLTSGKIAGRWELISISFPASSSVSSAVSSSYASSSTENNLSEVSYTYTNYSTNQHNLITGNSVRCTTAAGGLTANAVYYVINTSNTNNGSIQLSNSYSDALAGVAITFTSAVTIQFSRQAGWIRVEEGAKAVGNGGDPVTTTGGTGNYWVRNPYSGSTKTRNLLPSYSSTSSYQKGDRVLHNNLVWECLSNQNSSNSLTPANGLVEADLTGKHGAVMAEIPEFYTRKDFFDGYKWFNIKGADVSKDYDLMSFNRSSLPSVNVFSSGTEQNINFMWVIHKSQYNQLSTSERAKFFKHPMFLESSDSQEDRTYRMTAKEAGQVFPSGIVPIEGAGATNYTYKGNYLYFGRKHGFSVGKSIVYIKGISFGTIHYIPELTDGQTYYVADVQDNGKAIAVSLTKNGAIIPITADGIYYRSPGAFSAIVTKQAQNVISVSTTIGSPAYFTTEYDHQLMVGQKVQLFFNGTISNFVSGNFYYVFNPDYNNNTLALASTLENAISGTPINIAASFSFTGCYLKPYVVDNVDNPLIEINGLNTSTNTLTVDWVPGFSNHWLVTGDTVIYTGNITGLTSGAKYFAIYVTDSSIKLASSYLNAIDNIALPISGNVTGSYVVRADYSEVTYSGSCVSKVDFSLGGQNSTYYNLCKVNLDTPYNSYSVGYRAIFYTSYKTVSIPISSFQNNTFYTSTPHNLIDGNAVQLYYKAKPADYMNYNPGSLLFVINSTTNSFQLKSASNGTQAISFSNTTVASDIRVLFFKPTSCKVGGANNPSISGVWYTQNNKIYRMAAGAGNIPTYEQYYYGGWTESQYTTGSQFIFRRQNSNLSYYGVSSVFNNTLSVGMTINFIKNNQVLRFSGVSGLTGVSIDTDYYVINKSSDGTFQLSLSSGSTPIAISGSPSNVYLYPKIFDEVPDGMYYIRVHSDSGITLHRSYSESINNQNPLVITDQPKWSTSKYFVYSFENSSPKVFYGSFIYPYYAFSTYGFFNINNNNSWGSNNLLYLLALSELSTTESRVGGLFFVPNIHNFSSRNTLYRNISSGVYAYTKMTTHWTPVIHSSQQNLLTCIVKGKQFYFYFGLNQVGRTIRLGSSILINKTGSGFFFGLSKPNVNTGLMWSSSNYSVPDGAVPNLFFLYYNTSTIVVLLSTPDSINRLGVQMDMTLNSTYDGHEQQQLTC